MNQCTIKKEVEASGVGIHTGLPSTIKLLPAKENSGIVFIREDLPNSPGTKALIENVLSTKRGTNLTNINTVEHVLSALYALGIDNIEVVLSSSEPPVFDGSAIEYVKLLQKAGLAELNAEKKLIKVKDEIHINIEGKILTALPSNDFKIAATIDYPGTIVGNQVAIFEGKTDEYISNIAPARTFGFLSEAENLHKNGLALGGSLDNALIADKDKYLNTPRFKNEPARHKILDLIGDLALIGHVIHGNIISIKAGHELNIELARRILNARS